MVIVAYKLSKHNNNVLVRDTVIQIEDTIIPTKTLFHSDRGFQYTSHGFKKFIENTKPLKACPVLVNALITVQWKTSGTTSRKRCTD